MDERTCPHCKQHPLVKGEGKLDQSGESYLPTTTWACGGLYGGCGYKEWERAAPGTASVPYDLKLHVPLETK